MIDLAPGDKTRNANLANPLVSAALNKGLIWMRLIEINTV